jgi:thiol-disulfide isomerase/thioredoxin
MKTRSLPALFVLALVACVDLPAADSPRQARRVYDEAANAKDDIARAITRAGAEQKRVILVFGGNWCGDCMALDKYFHEAPAAGIIAANYIVVHVDAGRDNKNADVAAKYGVALNKGVPAVAVLEANGSVLYSQRNGEFEPAARMNPQVFVDFLNNWKPTGSEHRND